MRRHYNDAVRQKMVETFGYKNPMEVPKIDKIVVNMGVGESTNDSKKAQIAADDLTLIAGQKAQVTHARKSIATFKVREGMPLGAKVTLRGPRMYDFLDRLVHIALPRVRDFRGLNPNATGPEIVLPQRDRLNRIVIIGRLCVDVFAMLQQKV